MPIEVPLSRQVRSKELLILGGLAWAAEEESNVLLPAIIINVLSLLNVRSCEFGIHFLGLITLIFPCLSLFVGCRQPTDWLPFRQLWG